MGDTVTVQPRETDEALHNPWMGWGLWAGPVSGQGRRCTVEESTVGFGDDAPLFDWICLDWMWADLEPEEGKYYWDDLDRVMSYWVERGKQINLRVWATDDTGWAGTSGAAEVCPDWVWQAGAAYHEYNDEGGRKIKEPDYAHPSYKNVYLPRLRSFLEALAERYDKPGNPFNLVGCMGYGQWGEWHTLWSNYVWLSKEAKHEILAGIVEMYADIFRHSQLSVSYGPDTFHFGSLRYEKRSDGVMLMTMDDPEDFKHRQGLDVALAKGFALARHGFIDGLHYVDSVIMEQEWKRAPMYAEGNWSYGDMKRDGTHGTLEENIAVMLAWHSNYAHFYVGFEPYHTLMETDEDRAIFERYLKKGGLGYRLVLKEASFPEVVRPGGLLVLRQTWENQNVGRLYRRHLLKLHLFDSDGTERFSGSAGTFDPTGWVKGERYDVLSVFKLPGDLKPGGYEARIALVDAESETARIRLAIAGGDAELRYRIGTIRVEKT